MLKVYHWPDEVSLTRDEGGAFPVQSNTRYKATSPRPLDLWPTVLRRIHISGGQWVYWLNFRNYVGLAQVAGERFVVRTGKLTSAGFDAMLDQVVREVADLAFNFDKPTMLPQAREVTGLPEVRYHALAYLRWAMLRDEEQGGVLAQFRCIHRNPHNLTRWRWRWIHGWEAPRLVQRSLRDMVTHPEHLALPAAHSPLAHAGAGDRHPLLQGRFPEKVHVPRVSTTFDTHENRLVRHTLEICRELVDSFADEARINPGLSSDLRRMSEQLGWMAQADFLAGVSPMTQVPIASNVMKRQDGYRQFMSHYLALHLGATLAAPEGRGVWSRLLELKDCARLYELWCFFRVKSMLDQLLGQPGQARITLAGAYQRMVRAGAVLSYQDGWVSLLYTPMYRSGRGSISVDLQPDIVVRRQDPAGPNSLVLDAKFRFKGLKRAPDPTAASADYSERISQEEDIYKMHTYRDALPEVVGAFVLHPGDAPQCFPVCADGPLYRGVGALPLHPERCAWETEELLENFLRS